MTVSLAGLLLVIGASSMVQSQTSAADAVVPETPPLTLDLPVSPDVTVEVLQRTLSAARVVYGLEGAPRQTDSGAVDLGRTPVRRLRLNGRRLREALDEIVRADPRYEWYESDGRILVRAAGIADSALNQALPPLILTNASMRDTLAALMQTLAPGKMSSIISGGVAMSAGVPSAGLISGQHPVKPRAISSASTNATLLEILNSVARAHGGLSWVLKYLAGDTRRDMVSISLNTPGSFMAALPEAARANQAGRGLRVPIGPTLEIALIAYASQARVHTGVEAVVAPADAGPLTGGIGTIDVSALPPAEAVSRIVALDSRYAWADSGGVVVVRPRAELRERTPLDAVAPDFDVAGEGLDRVLDRLAAFFGGTGSGRGAGWSSRPGTPERQKEEAARDRPLAVRGSGMTVREILNLICRTEGTLSWTVKPILNPTGRVLVSIQLQSWDGWSTSRSFELANW